MKYPQPPRLSIQFLKDVIHKIMVEHAIINWNSVNKAILVLALGIADQVLWLIWCTYSYLHPVLQQSLNIAYIPMHLMIMLGNVAVISGLFIYGCLNKQKAWVKRYFPILAVGYFALAFIYGGYSVGITSPATVAGYISLFSVGIVLFERKIIYSIFFPITALLLSLILLTAHGYIMDAPVFNPQLQKTQLSTNLFWVYSMLYFYVPIFFASIVLFEMLLQQWQGREKYFNEISQIDPLTGIFNRRSISNALKQAQHEQAPYAIILLDLDHFKHINDHYGHDVGDTVLKTVAKILSQNIRNGVDIVGRFGGEEFILILKEKKINRILEIAERCRQEIERANIPLNNGQIKNEQILHITASFGVALSLSSFSEEEVIKHADQALYRAKNNGRNQIQQW